MKSVGELLGGPRAALPDYPGAAHFVAQLGRDTARDELVLRSGLRRAIAAGEREAAATLHAEARRRGINLNA